MCAFYVLHLLLTHTLVEEKPSLVVFTATLQLLRRLRRRGSRLLYVMQSHVRETRSYREIQFDYGKECYFCYCISDI